MTLHGDDFTRTRPDGPEADAFGREWGRRGAEGACLLAGGIAILLQFDRHLFGQALRRAERERVRRIALDEVLQVSAVLGIAMDIAHGGARSIVEQLDVTRVARHRVRSGRASWRVVGPLSRAGEVRAGNAREASAVTNIGADTIDGREFRFEQFVPVLERLFERFILLVGLHEREERSLIEVLGLRRMQRLDERHVGDDGAEQRRARTQHDRAQRRVDYGRTDTYSTSAHGGPRFSDKSWREDSAEGKG